MITIENYFDYQRKYECSGYASAYALRSQGEDVVGLDLYNRFTDKAKDGTLPAIYLRKNLNNMGYNCRLRIGCLLDLKYAVSETFDAYNNKPLFRYNTYFGFNTIYFMDLVSTTGLAKLDMPKIVAGALASRVKAATVTKSDKNILNSTARGLFAKLDGMKFLGCFDKTGKPWIIPIIQATHAGTDRVAFASTPFGDEIKNVKIGSKVAVLAVNMELQSVLVKGRYSKKGVVDIERVYNSMPPKMGYIYPRAEKPETITEF